MACFISDLPTAPNIGKKERARPVEDATADVSFLRDLRRKLMIPSRRFISTLACFFGPSVAFRHAHRIAVGRDRVSSLPVDEDMNLFFSFEVLCSSLVDLLYFPLIISSVDPST